MVGLGPAVEAGALDEGDVDPLEALLAAVEGHVHAAGLARSAARGDVHPAGLGHATGFRVAEVGGLVELDRGGRARGRWAPGTGDVLEDGPGLVGVRVGDRSG